VGRERPSIDERLVPLVHGFHDVGVRVSHERSTVALSFARRCALTGCIVASALFASSCSSSSSAAADEAVISSWKAALNAYSAAARNGDWKSPALAAAFLPPLLSSIENNLRSLQEAGDIAVGGEKVTGAIVAHANGNNATVVACVQDNEIVVDIATQTPVAGVLGRADPEQFTANLTKTSEGAWKVQQQSVKEGRCRVA